VRSRKDRAFGDLRPISAIRLLFPINASRTTSLISLLALSVVLTGIALAQPAESPDGETREGDGDAMVLDEGGGAVVLDQVTVTASSTEYSVRDAPASVSVIGREDIMKRPVTDLNEVLRQVPGVNMGFGSDNTRGVSIRGLGDEYTLILVDGKRVNAGLTTFRHYEGETNWVPADAIERIEVVRGPMSSLYGSDALGGVVNIITRKAGDRWRASVTGERIQPEDPDGGPTNRVAFTMDGPLVKDRLSLRVFGGYAKREEDDFGLNEDDSGRQGMENFEGSALLRLTPHDDHSFEFEVGHGEQEYLVREDEDDGNPVTVTRTSASLSHTGHWALGSSTVTGYAEWAKNEHDITTGSGNTGEVIGDGIEALAYQLEGKFTAPFTAYFEHTPTLGGMVRYEELDDPENMGQFNTVIGAAGDPVSDMTTFALFVEDNIALTEDLTLTGGLRMDHHEEFGVHFSPRAYLVYDLNPWLTLKGGWARGFRAPDIRELNPFWVSTSRGRGCGAVGGPCEMVGNPDLEPEISSTFEAGAVFERAGWVASATWFYNEIEDKITSAREPTLVLPDGTNFVRRINVDRARTHGIEGSLTVPVLDNVTWRNAFTYLFEARNLETNMPLSASPELALHSELAWYATDQLSLFLSANYYSEQVDYASEPETLSAQVVDPYATFDFSGTYDINEHFTVRAGVLNLLDEETGGDYNYNEDRRRYFLSLTTRF
jgi:outer membrane receptor for ferrienterochelin and colicins